MIKCENPIFEIENPEKNLTSMSHTQNQTESDLAFNICSIGNYILSYKGDRCIFFNMLNIRPSSRRGVFKCSNCIC